MDFWKLLKRFAPPYKKEIALNILFHFLATVFGVFSFATVIPVLQIMFGINDTEITYTAWDWSMPFSDIISACKKNIFFWINEQITVSGAPMVLFMLGLFLVGTSLLKTGTSYFGTFFMIPIRTGVLRDLRQQLYDKIIRLPMGYFTEEHKGDIMSRMTNDVVEVEYSLMSSLDMLFKNPIMITIYLVTLFTISWQLTLFVLVLLPIGGGIIGVIGRTLKRKSLEGQTLTGQLLTQIEESLGGLRIVKAFNAEGTLSKRFAALNEKTRRTFNKLNWRYEFAHPTSEFLGTVMIAILLWFGGGLILTDNSNIDAAEFIYYLIIFYSIINPAKDLSKAVYNIRKGMASLERIDKILLAENTIKEPEHPTPMPEFKNEIAYHNIHFSYNGEKEIIRGVDLKIFKGKTVALVGQSGSGKTTMLDLLPRFYDVQQGSVTIDGVDVRDIASSDLRALMGNVNQDPILFNDTFFNNIAFGMPNATMEQVVAAAKIANAHDFIMQTEKGYDTIVGDRGSRLSGGQRQRISIARAVLKNPPILILDEATSALDTESEKLVQEALNNLMQNRTTLVVAHRLSTIKKANHICVMHEGQIVEQGQHDQLLALGGYYTKLWQMQK